MTRSKLFVLNSTSTAIYQIAAMILGFITPTIMIRYYGDTLNGIVLILLDYMSYFKTLEAGLSSSAIFSLYEPLEKKDKGIISTIVSTAKQFYMRAGYGFTALVIVFALVYPLFPSTGALNYFSTFLLVLVIGLSGILEFFTLAKYRVLLTADQRTYIVSFASTVSLVVSTFVMIICAYLQVNVILMRLAVGSCILLRSAILAYYVKKHYSYVEFNKKPEPKYMSRRWDALYQEVTIVLQEGCGVIVSSLLIKDSILISVYATYRLVTKGLWSILKMTTTGLYASFGNLLVSNNMKRFQKVYDDFEFLFLFIVTVVYGTAFTTIDSFVGLLARGSTSIGAYYLPILGALLLLEGFFFHCKTPLDLCVVAAGHFRETRNHNTLHLLLCFAFSIILGLPFGLNGIILGLVIAHGIRVAIQLWYVPKTIIRISFKKSLLRIIRSLATIFLIALPVRFLFHYTPDRFITWVLYAAGVFAYACLVSLGISFLFDKAALKSIFLRGLSLFKK